MQQFLSGLLKWILSYLITESMHWLSSTRCTYLPLTVSEVWPCSLTVPVGFEARLTTTDLPAPLQAKISYQAATALCPAVWGLCQGFLQKCTGVHRPVGGKGRWRWEAGGEAFGPSLALSCFPQTDWTSSVKDLIKDHFQAPWVGHTFMHAVTKWKQCCYRYCHKQASAAGFSNQALKWAA